MMLKLFFTKLIKSLIGMMITEKFLVWAMRIVADKTKNQWDDAFVDIVEAGRNGDQELLKKGVQGVVDRFGLKIK